MNQSKFLRIVVLALLLLWSTANAQLPRKGEQPAKIAGEIPEMPVWWQATDVPELPNNHYVGEGVTFLANFYNGQNAMALRTASDEIHTWLNRFPGDTQNIFTWKAGYIKSGDFNGDGITDYVDGLGNIYGGVQNGQPPMPEPVKNYGVSGYVFDVNGDGYDDVVSGAFFSYGTVYNIVYGGTDIASLQAVQVKRTADIDTTNMPILLYMTPQGEMRLVCRIYYSEQSKQYRADGYRLFRVKYETGATQPAFEKLDERITSSAQPFQEFKPTYTGERAIYQSKRHNKTFLLMSEIIDKDYYRNNVAIYDLTNDTFTQSLKFRMDNANFNVLEHSVDGDEYEDWYMPRPNKECWFFSGGLTFDSVPKLKIVDAPVGSIASIDDITNDSISEVAIGGIGLKMFKGIKLTTDVVNIEDILLTFSFTESKPHPINFSGNALIGVSIDYSHTYTLSLYTVEGQNIAQVFQGWLDSGTQNIPLNLAPYNISAGSYLLRLSDGQNSIQRTIIITN